MSAFTDRIMKISSNRLAKPIKDSIICQPKVFVPTKVPMLNVALSGSISGGITGGITMIAGESKRFKTLYALYMIEAYMTAHPDTGVVFLDSEVGVTIDYLAKHKGINLDNFMHIPVTSIEHGSIEMVALLDDFFKEFQEKGSVPKVMFFLDSLANLPSEKEIDNFRKEKISVDMTRAKAAKAFFRLVTTKIALMNFPFIVITHVYKSQDFMPIDVVSGGTGGIYAANTIWIVKRRQVKEGEEVAGYEFVLSIDKSRFIKDKRKVPITVTFDKGIHFYSGLSDFAKGAKIIADCKFEDIKGKPKGIEFIRPDGEVIRCLSSEESNSHDFWQVVLKESRLSNVIEGYYALNPTVENIDDAQIDLSHIVEEDDEEPAKKRGRKSKGGSDEGELSYNDAPRATSTSMLTNVPTGTKSLT